MRRTREQLNRERIEAIVQLLEVQDLLKPEEAGQIRRGTRPNNIRGTADQFGPPDNVVQRGKFSEQSRQAFKDARDAGDVQAQLDVLYEVLTGETLGNLPRETPQHDGKTGGDGRI